MTDFQSLLLIISIKRMMRTAKEIRKLSKLSQTQFSEKYSIPVQTLRHWEQGQRKCPEYVLLLLERAVTEDFKAISQ